MGVVRHQGVHRVVASLAARLTEWWPSPGRSKADGMETAPSPAARLRVGVKTERIIFDRPTDRRLTEGKNGFGQIVAGYGHGYG
jgi:hypothetical protein